MDNKKTITIIILGLVAMAGILCFVPAFEVTPCQY